MNITKLSFLSVNIIALIIQNNNLKQESENKLNACLKN